LLKKFDGKQRQYNNKADIQGHQQPTALKHQLLNKIFNFVGRFVDGLARHGNPPSGWLMNGA
jgi:hypothetical protein